MTTEDIIESLKKLKSSFARREDVDGAYAQVCEFLKTYLGPKNTFLVQVQEYNPSKMVEQFSAKHISSILDGCISYLQSGLFRGISPERQAQLDVVSDFLGQAHTLLEDAHVHPATPAVIIGATLEEFLRTWIETEGLSLEGRKPSLDTYAKVLREAELICKQDVKDITAWAGIRNHAAHGEWHEVEDPRRVKLMLDGVNLFMRTYSPRSA